MCEQKFESQSIEIKTTFPATLGMVRGMEMIWAPNLIHGIIDPPENKAWGKITGAGMVWAHILAHSRIGYGNK